MGEPTPVDRVVMQDEARTVSFKAVLMSFPKSGTSFDFSDTEVEFENPVPVHDDACRTIGFASVDVEEDRLVAEVSIDYETEVRLLLETGHRLYARPLGEYVLGDEGYVDLYRDVVVAWIRIDGIVVTSTPPSDGNIPPLGKPVL